MQAVIFQPVLDSYVAYTCDNLADAFVQLTMDHFVNNSGPTVHRQLQL